MLALLGAMVVVGAGRGSLFRDCIWRALESRWVPYVSAQHGNTRQIKPLIWPLIWPAAARHHVRTPRLP